jgi:hypothetical protein
VILGSPGFLKLSFRKHDAKIGFLTLKERAVMIIIPDELAFLPGKSFPHPL